jgi:hypothetical protein
MAEYVRFEGTTDFLVHYPALITTFTAATAINAGDFVVLGADGRISGSAGTGLSGSTLCMGMAVRTAAVNERVGVITWGLIKNATFGGSNVVTGNVGNQGDYVEMLGGNFVASLGAYSKGTAPANLPATIGRIVFGPANPGVTVTVSSGSKVNIFLSPTL